MNFNHFLTSYMPDKSIGSKIHFENMIEESKFAEQFGFSTVSVFMRVFNVTYLLLLQKFIIIAKAASRIKK